MFNIVDDRKNVSLRIWAFVADDCFLAVFRPFRVVKKKRFSTFGI